MTKKTVPLTSIVAGVSVGVLIGTLNILVFFKTGLGFGGSVIVTLLGMFLLRLFGSLDWRNLFLTFSIASSGYFATAAMDSGIVAITLHGQSNPPWVLFYVLTIGANVAGVFIGSFIADIFVNIEKLRYPTIQPTIDLMANLTRENPVSRPLLFGIATSVAAAVLSPYMFAISNSIPSFLLPSFSPLLFGVGILIRASSSFWVFCGGVYSWLIWALSGDRFTAYHQHLTNVWILNAGIALIVGASIGVIWKYRYVLIYSLHSVRKEVWNQKWVVRSVPLLMLILLIWFVKKEGLITGIAGSILIPLLAVLVIFFLNRSGGEVGIAPLAPVLYFSLLLFTLIGMSHNTAILLASTISCLALTTVYYAYSVKISREKRGLVSTKEIVFTQLIGGIAGGMAGISVVWLFLQNGGVGNSQFPVPTAIAINYVYSFFSGQPTQWLSAAVFGIGGIIGLIAGFHSSMPSLLGIGMIIPPGSAITLALGGMVQWVVNRLPQLKGNAKGLDQFASGLIISDGLFEIIHLLHHL